MAAKNTTSVKVVENALPLVSIGGTFSFCTGASTTLLASGGNTFLWSDTSSKQDLIVTSGGPYSVMVTDSNGCKNADTVQVTENALPIVNAGADVKICEGIATNTTLKATGDADSYQWSNGPATSSFAVDLNITPINYIVTGTSKEGCTKLDTVLVVLLPKPNFTITPDITTKICGNDTTLQLLIGNCPGCSYLWDNDSTADTLEVDSNRTYKVTATLGTCSSSSSIEVSNFKTAVSFNLTATAATCNKKNGRITVTPLTGALPFDFVWSVGGPPSSNPSKDSLAPGSYTITVTDDNSAGR